MTAISYHDTVDDVQAIELQPRGPFGRRDWFAALERNVARPVYAVAEDASGGVIFPLRRNGRRLEALLNESAFTWRPLGTAYASADSLSIALARDLASKASHVVFDRVPDEDGTARQLQRAFERSGWLVERALCDTNRVLEVADRTYAEYLAERPEELRTALEREAASVDVTILDRFDPDAWAACGDTSAQRAGAHALLRRFAEAEGAAGRIRLAVARRDDQTLAAQFWTVEDRTAYVHIFTRIDSDSRLPAGSALTAALMEHAIDVDRVGQVDFGAGDTPCKQAWMDDARPRYRLQCWRRSDPRNWPAMAKRRLRTLVSRQPHG